jgi:5-formyltetrahydrofolate cyclo-ligase
MNKLELRNKYKELRNQLSEEDIESKSIAIANNLLHMNIWNNIYFHIYLPIVDKKEVNTEYILQILAGKDKEIVVSKSNFKLLTMTHYLVTENTKFINNSYNIPEPIDGIEVPVKKIQVVFVPLLVYDLKGNRIGYGKGFYDKFLSNCNPETLKIGLSFFNPVDKILDVSTNDIKLNYCVTPKKVFKF